MPIAKVELPDGRIARFEVPEGVTQAEVEAEAMRLFRQELIPGIPGTTVSTVGQRPEASFVAPMTRAAVTRAADAVLGVPELLFDLGARPTFGPAPTRQFSEQNLPLPTGEQAIAGIETAGQLIPGLLGGEPQDAGELFAANLAEARRTAAEHPIATATGEVLADAATIATGRVPLARTGALRFLREGRRPDLFFGATRLQPSRTRMLDRFLQGPTMTRLARGTGRAAEAGFEGAALAALHGGDPLQTAAYTAGGQTVGSILIGGTPLTRGVKPLAIRAATLAATIQMAKSILPGGRDRILESSEEAFDSLKWAIALGAAARVAGAGRVSQEMFERTMPGVAEAINSLHRGAVVSLVEHATNDEVTERTLQHLALAPERFRPEWRKRLDDAIGKGTLPETVRELMDESREFGKLIDSPPIPAHKIAGLLNDDDDD